MNRCGDHGHKSKDGQPCQFSLGPGMTACQHHDPNPARAKAILARAVEASQEMRLPDDLLTNGFETVGDCLAVRAKVVDILKTEKKPDYRRLDMILKATSGASSDHATKALEEQNKLLLALDGHGPGLAALQRLKESPIRVLPGKRSTS